MKAADILAAFGAVQDEQVAGRFRASCPVHEADARGHRPSLILDFNATSKHALVLCESRQCSVEDVVLAVGLSTRDLSGVSYIGQSMTSKGAAGASKTPAPEEARLHTAAGLYKAAHALSEHLDAEPEGRIATTLHSRYGIPARVNTAYADDLGIGLDANGWLVIAARTGSDSVAFAQGRNPDPDAERRWDSLANPDGARWDAAGFVGRRHKAAPVIVCEGMSDALTVAVLDRYDVVAVRGAKMAARISEVANDLIGRDVILAVDNDGAGREMREILIARLESLTGRLAVVSLPEGYDVGDFRDRDAATFPERFAALVGAAEVHERAVSFDIAPYKGGTDVDRAHALGAYAKATGLDLAHTDSHGWLVYDGEVWNARAEARVRQLAHSMGALVRRQAGDVYASGDKDGAQELDRTARGFLSSGCIDRSIKEAAAMPGIRASADDFDADKDVVGVANGVLDLRTGAVVPMTSGARLTRRLAVAFDPEVQAPKWEKFLREVFVLDSGKPDEETIAYVQQMIGYGITGHTSEQFFALLNGSGANGKSVFINVLSEVFGAIAQATAFSTFESKPSGSGIPNDLAALKGARLVVAQESNVGTRMDESMMKAVTGEDAISARFMRAEWFSFRPSFLLMLVTNHLPRFMGQDEGLWRRVKLIEFRRYFAPHERDRGLAARIIDEEAAGVLAWAAEGARAWYASGKRLPVSRAVEAASAGYRKESDVLGDFLAANVLKTGNRRNAMFHDDVHARYLDWADRQGVAKPIGRNTFGNMLKERLGPIPESAFPRHHRGFRLLDEREVAMRLAADRRAAQNEDDDPDEVETVALPPQLTAEKYAARFPFAGANLEDVTA